MAHHTGSRTTIPPTTTSTTTAEPTTTVIETTTEMATTDLSPINVRARFMDMPKVNLKFGMANDKDESSNVPKNLQNASRTQTETNTDKMTTQSPIIGLKNLQLDRIEPTISEREKNVADLTTSKPFEKPVTGLWRIMPETNPPSATESNARASMVAQTVKQTQTVPPATTPVYEEPREMCCGDYSDHRFPYYSLNRGCCNGKTFDTLNLQCCNGVIKSIFSEC